jgi:uncharacterized protein (TIGR02421 family)
VQTPNPELLLAVRPKSVDTGPNRHTGRFAGIRWGYEAAVSLHGQDLDLVRQIDHRLTELEREVNLLLNMTPLNTADAWLDFEAAGYATEPVLQSRPLDFDPDLLRRNLYDLAIEEVEDPSLKSVLRHKRDEINSHLTLLEDRDSPRSVLTSQRLFGQVDDRLVEEAESLLGSIDPTPPKDTKVSAVAFAERAERELEHYRTTQGGIAATVEIRDDVPDLMVSYGKLLVGAESSFMSSRVEALVQHEVGTHVVTFENGRSQPLKMLSVGLPGYEETQEGLALLAEHSVGGLSLHRVRLIAARVVAIRRRLDGASFVEIFELLHEDHHFAPRIAWSITVRVARGGGLTKDAIYLRGLVRVLEFLSESDDFGPLFAGKMALDHVPLVNDLIEKEILCPARIVPRWVEMPENEARLARIFDGIGVTDLVAERAAS